MRPLLTHGSVGATLLRFALPVLGGYVLQSLGHSLHAAWIGSALGGAALAAATQANNVLFALIAVVFGISQAAGILVAQALGAGAPGQARRATGTGASLFLGSAVLIAVAGWPLAPVLLDWIHTPPAVAPLAQSYLRWLLLALPLQMLFIYVTAVLRGAGEAHRPFCFLLGGVALDAALAPALILGWGPIPAMGMAGSALALGLSQAASLAALLAWMRCTHHPLWMSLRDRHLFVPDGRTAQALVRTGLPMGLQMVVVSGALVALLAVVNPQGERIASAYSAAMQLWTYVQMPALALGAACTSMAAQCVGAGDWQRIGRITRCGVLYSLALTGGLVALVLLLDRQALSLFLPAESPALASARQINQVVIGSFMLLGVSAVLAGVVRSTGAVWAPLWLLVLTLWGMRLPVAAGLQPWWGADALWWSFPVSALCSLAMSLAYYRWGRWRQPPQLLDGLPLDHRARQAPATAA
ncbi:MAG: MATE family efflux transporter [Comamonadaceae bacterium]|nr:MAG: MATE family efflux transporter [Comamonadaceae bacterium]